MQGREVGDKMTSINKLDITYLDNQMSILEKISAKLPPRERCINLNRKLIAIKPRGEVFDRLIEIDYKFLEMHTQLSSN